VAIILYLQCCGMKNSANRKLASGRYHNVTLLNWRLLGEFVQDELLTAHCKQLTGNTPPSALSRVFSGLTIIFHRSACSAASISKGRMISP
jgi:hypothetical protein